MNIRKKELLVAFILIVLAAVSPNLFPAAQAGMSTFPSLAIRFLLPSAILIFVVIGIARGLKFTEVTRLAINGILAGIIATIALEVFRESGFKFGWMPGDLPRLMGVLLLDQFASGPDIWSDIAGWVYHFWNGAVFGLIFSLLLGQSKLWQGLVYGLLIGVGFMISPVTKSLGIGYFGIDFKDGYQFASIVTIAHIAFGLSLSFLLVRWNKGVLNIWTRWRS